MDKCPMPGKLVVTPINPETLSFGDKRKVPEAVYLIKEKICGKQRGEPAHMSVIKTYT